MGHVTIDISFTPKDIGHTSTYYILRNNLTLVELITLRGEGSKGILVVPQVCAGIRYHAFVSLQFHSVADLV